MRFPVILVCGFQIASVAAASTAPGLESVPLAAPSAPAGTTLFQIVDLPVSGLVAPNKYAEPGVLADGRHDPRQWVDRYHVLDVGAIGTGVAIGDDDGDNRVDYVAGNLGLNPTYRAGATGIRRSHRPPGLSDFPTIASRPFFPPLYS